MSLHRVGRRWEELARTDPLWAILSDPQKKGNRWEVDEFFRTGRREIDAVLGYLEPLHRLPGRRRALDFGCGAGRLTQALAGHFEEVRGVDVSPSMVELARRHNRHGARCTYHENQVPRLPFADAFFDFIYSSITLQHIPPRAARSYIREFFRVLVPGGVTVFQQAADPGAASTALRRAARRLMPRRVADAVRELRLTMRPTETFEMHGLPRAAVERLIRQSGGRLLDVVDDDSAGAGWTSFRYCAVRTSV